MFQYKPISFKNVNLFFQSCYSHNCSWFITSSYSFDISFIQLRLAHALTFKCFCNDCRALSVTYALLTNVSAYSFKKGVAKGTTNLLLNIHTKNKILLRVATFSNILVRHIVAKIYTNFMVTFSASGWRSHRIGHNITQPVKNYQICW